MAVVVFENCFYYLRIIIIVAYNDGVGENKR